VAPRVKRSVGPLSHPRGRPLQISPPPRGPGSAGSNTQGAARSCTPPRTEEEWGIWRPRLHQVDGGSLEARVAYRAVHSRGTPRALAAAEHVLDWLMSPAHRRSIRTKNGLARQDASQEGNALAVCCRLGLARDARVEALVQSLLGSQWPDGGWICDPSPRASHSSFYESITPLWGLIEYTRVTGDTTVTAAAERASELFLERGMFRSKSTGDVIDDKWLKLHYPLYWHYDILHGLLILSRFGKLGDRRARDALDMIEAKRRDDGCWTVEGRYWRGVGNGSTMEVVDWGRQGRNEFITLNALRVLRAADRL
jgi:hypothetical protein